jgi:Flp pilus assembly protein TadD
MYNGARLITKDMIDDLITQVEKWQAEPFCVEGTYSTNAKLFFDKGRQHFRDKQYELAIFCYKEVLRGYPHDSNALNNLGAIYHEQLRYDEAAKLYLRAIEADARNAQARNNLGNVFK